MGGGRRIYVYGRIKFVSGLRKLGGEEGGKSSKIKGPDKIRLYPSGILGLNAQILNNGIIITNGGGTTVVCHRVGGLNDSAEGAVLHKLTVP
ncbi:hypothetical protein QE152_g8167 [Popillia japonica]|uniref:Uncharacterized protein n=1 Tax=Popillia japonica TaxID=7064 RepID=A0AAW1MD19_POPJA